MKMQITVLAAAGMLFGCASKSESIQASYVSPVLYQNLTCEQLHLEGQAISGRAIAASGVQDKKAGQDAAVMAVGIVLFWPALFFTSGDGASAAEVARLKGEMDAIEAASRVNGCGITFNRAPPPKLPAKAEPSNR
ncbi:hypothetical protein [Mesorhizobium sp. CAU 1732]|uniref:hypothetical protein n=1 Tax=Mesorhizobium sp. CAU 1732 TaxID=3140358 RepID=UPI0032602DDA